MADASPPSSAASDEPSIPGASTPFDAKAAPALPVRAITLLVVEGENIELRLPLDQERFTLGAAPSPSVDLTLAGDSVSRLHVVLERRGAKLHVVDQRSTNGTYFRGHRLDDFEILPGDVFEVSRRVRLLALDPALASLRGRLLWVVGLRNRPAADAALQVIAADAPILLLGPPGCEQRALAEEIHRRSGRSDRDFVVAPPDLGKRADQDLLLARAQGSTIYLDLATVTKDLPGHFVAGAFRTSRPIVAAPTEAHAVELLDTYARQLRVIDLKTPAERPDDIPRLLETLVIDEHSRSGASGELLPFAALGAANLEGLKRHPWSGNFPELRHQAKRLHAVLTNGLGIRASARALGLKSATSLIEALDRINVHLKRTDGDELPIDVENGEKLPTPPGSPTRPGT